MNLRERTRQAVREDISRSAWVLFAERGFEGTTVEQIADAAGMSKRSFFRYFANKEQVVLDRLLLSGSEIADAMAARPAEEAAWPALRAALEPAVRAQEQQAYRTRALLTMLREPGLRATLQERQHRWGAMLAPLIAERLAPRTSGRSARPRTSDLDIDPRPAAIAWAAIVCMEAAQDAWSVDRVTPLGVLLDEAMGAVAPL